jgi:hypothetical protein
MPSTQRVVSTTTPSVDEVESTEPTSSAHVGGAGATESGGAGRGSTRNRLRFPGPDRNEGSEVLARNAQTAPAGY